LTRSVVVRTNFLKSSNRTEEASRKKYMPPRRMSGSSEPRNTRRSKPESTPVTSEW